MRIFLTGGTGFIGRPLIQLLAERGHEILALTRSSQIKNPLESHALSYVSADLHDSAAVYSAMKDFRPKALVHLAWEGLPDYSLEISRRNLKYGIDVFSLAAKAGCSCILSTGSCWEYACRKGMLAEDDMLESTKMFPAVKNSLRFIGEAISRENGLRFYWLRLFFVYGQGQRPTSLIPDIIECVKAGKIPQIQTPYNRHDFVFVGDVARAISGVLESQPENSVYNVGSGQSIVVEDVVRIAHEIMNRPFEERNLSRDKPIATEDFWADTSRIHSDIGWKAGHDIRSGIKKTFENLRAGN